MKGCEMGWFFFKCKRHGEEIERKKSEKNMNKFISRDFWRYITQPEYSFRSSKS